MQKSIWALGFMIILGMLGCSHSPSYSNISEIMSPEQTKALFEADIILLGEQHDNPQHHRIQAQLLELLGKANVLAAVVFEQVSWDQQAILDGLNNRNIGSLPVLLNWDKSGWPDYALYEALFTAAVRFRASVIAGNISSEKSKAIYQNGYKAIFTLEEQQRLGLNHDLEAEGLAALRKEIFDGHCQLIPEDHIGSMIPIQRARDAAMALAYDRQHKKAKTVYIVGSGHARKDFGIPWYLKKLKPELKIWSIGMNETGASTETGIFDQVITTAPAERDDPCESLKTKWKKPGATPSIQQKETAES